MSITVLYMQALLEIQEALINFSDVYADLWPEEDTPRIIQRVLVHYNFAAGTRTSEADRCKFITEFCDSLLRDNACRALVSDPPLSFRRAKERWTEMAERYPQTAHAAYAAPAAHAAYAAPAPAPVQQQASQASSNRGRGGSNRGAGTGSGARGGSQFKGRTARHFVGGVGYPVCFDFNRASGCTKRAPKGCGCEDARGAIFAHACNFYDTTTGKFCLAVHPREGNH